MQAEGGGGLDQTFDFFLSEFFLCLRPDPDHPAAERHLILAVGFNPRAFTEMQRRRVATLETLSPQTRLSCHSGVATRRTRPLPDLTVG